ncbi:MAG: glycosyltransferase family 4 protein [Kaiparowitsia implicata GSE-PSE-MK54-09C]|nr:glycosyltransferase family 4 protein [Kaiparowitsia implicata GSE-PSE-MK54-09C]
MTSASNSPVLMNLSMVGQRQTGIAIYASQIALHLTSDSLALLSPSHWRDRVSTDPRLRERQWAVVPSNLSPDDGKVGHLRRLLWTQRSVPRLMAQWHGRLFFSPVPEAPLGVGCRSVVMVHDLIPLRFPQWRSPLTLYFRAYVPQVLRQAAHILCNSEATAREVSDRFAIPTHRITPIHLAYDAQHFQPQRGSTQNYFVYLGRHDPHKNLERLVRAFAALPQAQELELWLVGPTDARYTPLLLTLAQELGVGGQVRCLDYVPYAELPQILGGAIALVFPSLWEGFGLPVLEAMACGTPVITSTAAALPEVAGDAALLVSPTDIRALMDAMQHVALDSSVRSHLRSAGLARASQFSWATTGKRTSEVLQQCLQ